MNQSRHTTRPPLQEVAAELVQREPDALREIVARRLQKLPVAILPPLARDEDPADILIASAEQSEKAGEHLRDVAAGLAERWCDLPADRIARDPEPLGELVFLCAMIGARRALTSISRLAERDNVAGVPLSGGEDLRNRALRSVSGLLGDVSPEERVDARRLFEHALDTPAHAAIGLTTLATFWPRERNVFVERALRHRDPYLEDLARRLDPLVTGLDAHDEVPA